MSDDFWAKIHKRYSEKDWATKPSLFAEATKEYLPPKGKLLELGAGLGQDSVFFSQLGYEVTSTDLNTDCLNELAGSKFKVKRVDMRSPLPFQETSFDIVYAHLSLHYFDKETTVRIFHEIHRILKPDGVLAFFANSTSDLEYNTGKQLEDHLFEIEGTVKRYFDVKQAKIFTKRFKTLLLDDKGETYKDRAKGVHNLIRYIGKK